MGAGPQIVVYDASMVSHTGLREFVLMLQKKQAFRINLKQWLAAVRMQVQSTLQQMVFQSLAIGVATRYIHSHAGFYTVMTMIMR